VRALTCIAFNDSLAPTTPNTKSDTMRRTGHAKPVRPRAAPGKKLLIDDFVFEILRGTARHIHVLRRVTACANNEPARRQSARDHVQTTDERD